MELDNDKIEFQIKCEDINILLMSIAHTNHSEFCHINLVWYDSDTLTAKLSVSKTTPVEFIFQLGSKYEWLIFDKNKI